MGIPTKDDGSYAFCYRMGKSYHAMCAVSLILGTYKWKNLEKVPS